MASIDYFEEPLFGGYFEPVNTVSNIFFLCAAYFIHRERKRHGIQDRFSQAYLWSTILVGLGSAAWHFHQAGVTLLLDVVPMFGLIAMAVGRAAFLIGRNRLQGIIILGCTLLLVFVGRFTLVDGGVTGHGPLAVLPSLIFLGGLAYLRGGQAKGISLPAGVFVLSVVFRQLDHMAGAYVPFGSHFLWHLLNAVVLYLLFRAFYPQNEKAVQS